MVSIPRILKSHWWRFPITWWWRSLPLRVVLTVFLASVMVVVLGGFLLMQQATIGVIDGKKETAKNEARQAINTAQGQLDAADLTGEVNVDKLLLDLATGFRESSAAIRSDHHCPWSNDHGRQRGVQKHSASVSKAG
jgi:two-component system sensor histidine kinase MtrB